MQEKTIKSVLRKKIDDWCTNVDDKDLKILIQRDTICTGGAISSMLTGEDVNDYDIYFKTRETTKRVAEYYLGKFLQNPPSSFKNSSQEIKMVVIAKDDRVEIRVQSQGIAGESGTADYQYFEGVTDPSEPEAFVNNLAKDLEESNQKEGKSKYRPIFITQNAITLSDKVQIIIRFFGSVDQIHENYDYVHCTCSWESSTGELRIPQKALISLINKRLKYQSSKYPLCSIIRSRKFIKRGWHIDAGQYLKMAWDLNKLDLENLEVLEDQLTGVDSAYFYEVIEILKSRKEEGKQIDDTYLMQVVDKIFG